MDTRNDVTKPPQPTFHPRSAPMQQNTSTRRGVAVTFTVLGALVLGGTLLYVLLGTVFAPTPINENLTQPVKNVDAIDVSASAGEMNIVFGDVNQAQLDVKNGRGSWTMRDDNGTLIIRAPNNFWLNSLFLPSQSVTLTLPESLEGKVDGKFDLAAGNLTTTGEFDSLTIDVSAGNATVKASATHLNGNVSAGELSAEVAGVQYADLSMSAGSARVQLTETPPSHVSVDVSAGSMALILPETEYDMRVGEAAGTVDSSIRTRSSSTHVVEGSVSAGSLTLRH